MDTRAIPASLKETLPVRSNRRLLRFKFFWFVLLPILLITAAIYALRYELRSYVFLIQFLNPHASGILVRLEGHRFDMKKSTFPQRKARCEQGCMCRAELPIRRAWSSFTAFIIWESMSLG